MIEDFFHQSTSISLINKSCIILQTPGQKYDNGLRSSKTSQLQTKKITSVTVRNLSSITASDNMTSPVVKSWIQ